MAAVPVLLMNPRGEKMARRRKRSRSRSPARTSNPRRRRRRRASSRRRGAPRRRRNPGFDLITTGLALLGGAAIGAGSYALEGAAMAPVTNAAIIGGAGAVGGLLAGSLHKGIGAGIAGAGAGIATVALLRHFMEAKATEQTSSVRRFGSPGWRTMNAVQGYLPYGQQAATLRGMGAVQARVGANRRAVLT